MARRFSLLLTILLFSCASEHPSDKNFVFPVMASDNGRYLTDQENNPFFISSDAAWSMLVALTTKEAEAYLDDRKEKGFTSITVNIIEHWYKGDSAAYPYSSTNRFGQSPFQASLSDSVVDFSAPDESYFSHVDTILKLALEKNILVMMSAAYTGYKGTKEGWFNEINVNGPERIREYGRFLGKRYGTVPNILWIIDGDRNPDSLTRLIERELVSGIKEYDTIHLFTSVCHPMNSSRDQWEGEPWLGLNAVYTYDWTAWVHEQALDNYSRNPAMPCFLFETCYENEHNCNASQLRADMYWGWLCTVAGHQTGNKPVWRFGTGWKEALESQLSNDAKRLKLLAISTEWWNLVPDINHEILVSGYGEKENFAACAATPGGKTVIVYIPEGGGKINIDIGKLKGGKVSARWFDPATAVFIKAGKFRTKGIQSFEKPSGNDQVLIIEG